MKKFVCTVCGYVYEGEAAPEKCPVCGMPQIKVTAFRSKPRVLCIDPECETNKEPDLEVGICPTCKEKGLEKKLIARKNPRTLKRFIRCENQPLKRPYGIWPVI